MTVALDFQLHGGDRTSMFRSSIRLVALLRARSFIRFSLSRCSRVGDSYWSTVSSSESKRVAIEALKLSINLNLFPMNTRITPPPSEPAPAIRPLRPLVYNFFLSERPAILQQAQEQVDIDSYKSFHSQRVQPKNNHFFTPTLQFKKLIDQPKFLLSVQRKKIKIMRGINQKASPQKPSRNSYRGSKLRNNFKTVTNQQDPELSPNKDRPIQSQEMGCLPSPRKPKQPHLHFNLRHLLQTRKHFNLQFSREQNITGSNYPYYQYFSSDKSNIPRSQHTTREKKHKDSQDKKRYISTTMGVRAKPAFNAFDC